MKYTIDNIGGNCPVQAFGKIDDGSGHRFYFRARGSAWALSIGVADDEDYIIDPIWYHEEAYGEWPAAGWMDVSEAETFIDRAIQMWGMNKQ